MLPKYKYLLTYRYAEIVHDLTVEFCLKYLSNPVSTLGNLRDLSSIPTRRTIDQMTQAGRSNKQNIAEGISQETTLKGQIKFLGFAKGSAEELTLDFEDFLRQRNLPIHPKTDPKVTEFRKIGYRLSDLRNLSNLGNLIEKPKLLGNPTDDANFLLTLCHLLSYLLDRQIKATEKKFLKEGGYTENLYNKRIVFRRREELKKLKEST